ncbi:hypothetical protein FRC06_007554 [Ceratobasidium sp. 370]|nr:hypothetical protein FRC06_007554 [Ceratobasidium sp. 370]
MFYAVSVILIVLLATLNVAIAGNDVVTELKDNPNNTDTKCISTNSSETPPTLKFSTTFSRMANTDLGSDDIVDYISSYVVPRVSEIKDAESVLLANGSTPLNMLGVLDAFGSELLKALWARKWTWKIAGNESWPDQAVVKWSSNPTCWRANANQRCRSSGPETGGIDSWYSNTKGSQDFNPVYLTPMNTTLFNYLVAMRDAIHLDLGNVNHSTNIFLSTTAFQQRILHDPFMNWTAPQIIGHRRPDNGTPYTPDQFWRTCTWGWGCVAGTWTDALLTQDPTQNISKGLPIDDFGGTQYPTVIDVKYVCPVFRPKKIGALLVSVFIGTFSMYTALYGIFLFVAPRMDEWYRRRRGLRRFSLDMDDLGPYSSITGPFAYQAPNSSNPYNTVFDAADIYHYHNEAAPRYDPVAYPIYPSQPPSIRKSSLPAGAYLPSPGPHPEPLAPFFANISPTAATGSRTSTFVDTPRNPEQDALLPGCFEPNDNPAPSTSGNSARTLAQAEVRFVPATTEHSVSVENVNALRASESFKATVVGAGGT